MSAQKTVCLVINSLGGGGAERVFSRLSNLLSKQNEKYKVVVVTLDNEEIKNPIDPEIKHINLNCGGSLLKSITNLWKELNRINADVVVSFLTRANVSASLYGIFHKSSVVISERVNTSSHFGSGVKSLLKKKFVRFFYARSDSIVAVSEGVKSDLIKFFQLPEKRVSVIGNSYSYEELSTKAEQSDVEFDKGSYLVCVGRFYPNKNHRLLLKALSEANDAMKVVLLGDGPEKQNLKSLAKSLGIEDKVVFKGFIKNPYPYINNSAGLISTSLAEGFPNVIAEALVLGKFVVSSDCQSGPSELLDERVYSNTSELTLAKYGALLPLNQLEGTVAGIELFNNSDVKRSYETKVLELRDKFSHEAFIGKFTDVIEGVCRAN